MTAFVFTPVDESKQWDMEVRRALQASDELVFVTEEIHSFGSATHYRESLARSTRVASDALFAWATRMGVTVELETVTIAKIVENFLRENDERIGINISPPAFLSPAIVSLLRTRPHQLVLEISELAPAFDAQPVSIALADLRADGLEIALDNFGVGNAGLRLLLELEPDWVKIDRSLVGNIADPKIQGAIRALIDMAHDAGARAIVVGVENEDQLALADAMGADGWQGYLQPPPVPTNVSPRVGSLVRPFPAPKSADLLLSPDDSVGYALSCWLRSGFLSGGTASPSNCAVVASNDRRIGWLKLDDLIEAFTQLA